MWECWGYPSCSTPSPFPPPRIEQQERPGWRSRLGCSETNPEWYHSAVSQRPTPVPKCHQEGSATLRTLCPTRVVLPQAPVAFPWDRSGPGCAGRCCPSACSLRIQTQEERNQDWADHQTSAWRRGGAGTQGTRGSGRGTPGSPMGTPFDSQGPLPSVPPPPCHSCRPGACGAGNAGPA